MDVPHVLQTLGCGAGVEGGIGTLPFASRQQLVQPLIERMPRSRGQLRVRYPDVLLLLPLLARPHRHVRILRTKLVDTSTFFCSRIQTYTTGC